MILGLPLAIWFGFLTFISLFTTASLGIAVFKFNKSHLFKYHKTFAFITITLAICHLVLAFLLWFKGISV